MNRATKDRFWRNVSVNPSTGCYDWIGYIDKLGYGVFSLGGVSLKAHRLMYEISVGEIPEKYYVHHICFNKHCVNPGHLKVMSASEHTRLHNYIRKQIKERA